MTKLSCSYSLSVTHVFAITMSVPLHHLRTHYSFNARALMALMARAPFCRGAVGLKLLAAGCCTFGGCSTSPYTSPVSRLWSTRVLLSCLRKKKEHLDDQFITSMPHLAPPAATLHPLISFPFLQQEWSDPSNLVGDNIQLCLHFREVAFPLTAAQQKQGLPLQLPALGKELDGNCQWQGLLWVA